MSSLEGAFVSAISCGRRRLVCCRMNDAVRSHCRATFGSQCKRFSPGIVATAVATNSAYDSPRPKEFKTTATKWKQHGRRIDVAYEAVPKPWYEEALDAGVKFKSYTEQYIDSLGVFGEAIIGVLAAVAAQVGVQKYGREPGAPGFLIFAREALAHFHLSPPSA